MHNTISKTLRAQYLSHIRGDLAGGLASAMMAMPGNVIFGLMAFAPLGAAHTGRAILAGLYSSAFAGFFVTIFGDTRGMIVGPAPPTMLVFGAVTTQLMAVGALNSESSSGLITLLTLGFCMVCFSGLLQIIFGILHLGSMVKYISYPVVAGVLNGTVIIILKEAFWGYLGVPKQPLSDLLNHLGQIQPLSIVIALASTLSWLKGETYIRRIPGAALSLLVGTALYYGLRAAGLATASGSTLGPVSAGFPGAKYIVGFGHAYSTLVQPQIWPVLLSGALIIALLGSTDSLLAMLAMQNLTHVRGNSNRELIGQGLGNMVNGLFGALPSGGAVSYVTANFRAGGRTRLSGIVFSLTTLIVVLFGTNYLGFIPKAAIAGMTVVVAIIVLDKWSVQLVKRTMQKDIHNRRELLLNLSIMLVVMGAVVGFNVMTAVVVGIVISALMFISQTSRSIVRNIYNGGKIHSKYQRDIRNMEALRVHGHQISIVELEGPVFFGATDTLVQSIDGLVESGSHFIILDMKRVRGADVSGIRVLIQTYTQMRQKGDSLVFSYISPGTELYTFLIDLGLLQTVEATHMFVDTDQALEYCEELLLKEVNPSLTPNKAVLLQEVLGIQQIDAEELYGFQECFVKETYKAGELLCRQGDRGDSMYIITRGLVDITIPIPGARRTKRLATFGYGTIFGEVALLDQGNRSANVEVREDLTCYKITIDALEQLKRMYPRIAMMLMDTLSKVLVARLRQLTETVGEMER